MTDLTGFLPQVSPFVINILDASGNILGDGPIVSVTRLDTVARLDKIGECTFELPAADERTQFIAAGCMFDIWESPANDMTEGYLGRYLYKSKRLTDNLGVATLRVNCYDALRELSMYTVAFRRVYDAVAVETVIDDLVAVVPGWSTDVDAGIGTTSVTYEGESPIAAVDVLRDRWGQHYRLQSTDPATKVLEFGAFGTDSGIRITNLDGQEQGAFEMRPEIAIATRISLVEEADEIFNSVVALGAGQGVSQLTMEDAVDGVYALEEGINEDGTSYWYIQDAASVAAYGVRWKVLSLPSVRPISNSATGIEYAANALKLMAEAYIARHLTPRTTYDIQTVALRKDVKVGDTVRLVYRGIVEGYSYVDVDADFYVMDLAINRDVNGTRTSKLTIASIADRRTTDADIVVDVVRDIKALKIHVPITLAYAPIGPHVRRIDSSHDAEFTARIKDEVIYCNRALLRFKTSHLTSSVTSAASGGGATSSSGGGATVSSAGGGNHYHGIASSDTTAPAGTKTIWRYFYGENSPGLVKVQLTVDSGYSYNEALLATPTNDHTHSVTISNHTHTVPDHTHGLTYGLYSDTSYPTSIDVAINGVDVTAALGGPWDAGGTGADVEVDITDYLVNAIGGLRQNHTITFSCDSGQGEIEAEVDLLVSIQSISIV